MPLAREQRNTLVRVLRWSRANGWTHDIYPHTWRSADNQAHVRYDAMEQELVVDRMTSDPLRCRVTLVPVETPETAIDVLAALGYLPLGLAPLAERLLNGPAADPIPQRDQPAGNAFDGPASFLEAGQAFADWVDGRVTAEQAAEGLSRLARAGLIVSVGYHDETRGGPAAEAALMADLAAIIDGDDQ